MSKSYIAEQIDKEYKKEQFYKKRKRQQCKEIKCMNCKFFEICTESGERDDQFYFNVDNDYIESITNCMCINQLSIDYSYMYDYCQCDSR